MDNLKKYKNSKIIHILYYNPLSCNNFLSWQKTGVPKSKSKHLMAHDTANTMNFGITLLTLFTLPAAHPQLIQAMLHLQWVCVPRSSSMEHVS